MNLITFCFHHDYTYMMSLIWTIKINQSWHDKKHCLPVSARTQTTIRKNIEIKSAELLSDVDPWVNTNHVPWLEQAHAAAIYRLDWIIHVLV